MYDELFSLHLASLPPSVGVIVSVDESDHQFQLRRLQMDSASMAGVAESRTHESAGRFIYTFSVHSASLCARKPPCRCLPLIADAHINHRSAHLIPSPSFSGSGGGTIGPSQLSGKFKRRKFILCGRKMKTRDIRVNNLIDNLRGV